MTRTEIRIPWLLRLSLLFGGKLVLTWNYSLATGLQIRNIDVQMGNPGNPFYKGGRIWQ